MCLRKCGAPVPCDMKCSMNGAKRLRTSSPAAASELSTIQIALVDLVALSTGRSESDVAVALGMPPSVASSTTLLEFGVTSAVCAGLRSRVFKQLEAEVTSFELLTTPFCDLLQLIAEARKQDVLLGAAIPPAAAPV